jgi:hypothetical protein
VRIGVLCDPKIGAWAIETLERAIEETDAEIVLLVINDGARALESVDRPRYEQWLDHLRDGLDEGLWGLSRKAAYAIAGTPWYQRQHPVETVECFEDVPTEWCSPHPADGLGVELPTETVERIERETDVVVRFGFGILQGGVLDAPRHGVLSFHHGDIRAYRGRPAGFWEFLQEECVAGVTLQRLTPELDGGAIVAFDTVDITDAPTWQTVRERLFVASLDLLAEGIASLEAGDEPDEPDTLGTLYTVPEAVATIRYAVKNTLGRLRQGR